MRSQLEMQKDPLWGVIHGKLTQQERDLLVEVMTDIRREAFEECAKIAEEQLKTTSLLLSEPPQSKAAFIILQQIRSEHPNP